MFNGAHVILYSADAELDRAFLRDVCGFANVDAGGGWLIFQLPPAEVAVHPADGPAAHELYLMCDDVARVVTELAAKGVEATAPVDVRWGIVATITLPSGAPLSIYEPRHPLARDLNG